MKFLPHNLKKDGIITEPEGAVVCLIIEMQNRYRLHGKDKIMDKKTFAENILSMEDMLYRVSKSICFYECDCEDAVQEAILKAYSNLGTLREERYFKTWLTRILINECYRINKSKNREVSFFEYTLSEEAREEEFSAVFDSVMRLPEKIRITVQLHCVEGYSVAETAEILKIPQGTVKSRLSQGRMKLKNILEE